MIPLLRIEEPLPLAPGQRPPWALWALGFRPFYLLASVFAALSVPLWAMQYAGAWPVAALAGPVAHAHEMVFGFAFAVVVGFLFTAGRSWSGQPTPEGRPLMALAALWLAARVLAFTPWGVAAALANLGFALASAWALHRALRAGRNRNNDFFPWLLVAMGVASVLVQALARGWLAWTPALPGNLGLTLALDLVLLIMVVMGGRVIPMFTNNGVPTAKARRIDHLERASLGLVVALLAADAASGLAGPWLAGTPWPAAATGVLALAAALVHLGRWALWQPWATRRAPLVWVLHAAYAWIPVHLLLRAAAAAGWLATSLATHALTAGAIGGLTIGMMTRTARGHTGRVLRADAVDVACYVLVLGAALCRVAVPALWPAALPAAVLASSAGWAAGFGLYALHYGPWLCRARVDGRPG